VASAGLNAIPFRSRGPESNAQIGRLSWRRRAIVRLAKRPAAFEALPQALAGLACADVCFWHVCDTARSRMDFRFRCKSSRATDITSKTGFDPFETSAGPCAPVPQAGEIG